MINILYLHAGSELYGADKVMLELIKGLDKSKFNPVVILPEEGPLLNELRKANVDAKCIHYPILRRKMFNFGGLIKYAINYIKYSKLLSKEAKEKNIEIVHVNTTAVLEGIFLKIFSKKKIVWHVHEIIQSPKAVYKFTSFLVNKFSDKIIVVSEATKNHLINSKVVDSSKILVIYNGVNGEIYSPNNKIEYLLKEFNLGSSDRIVVGMIGRVNSWKGQKDFLKALGPLLDRHHNLYIFMVGGVFLGEEHFFDELLKLVSIQKDKDRIVVSDFRNDIENIQNMFDIFVLPSTNPDPLPTVVLEAMASGKPIVGYNHGGVKEMVVNNYNGILCTPRNPRQLGISIEKLINDKSKRLEMGANSLKRQRKYFDKNIYVQKFETIYLEL